MPLREALRIGGWTTVITIGLAGALVGFDNVAVAVLSPDVQETLGASDAVMGAIAGAGGVLFLLGSVPISSLADRLPRTRIAAVCVALWSVLIALTGMVQNAFSLFMARVGTGLAQSYELPVNGPVLIDAYPIEARGRVFGLSFSFQLGGFIVAPLLAGGITELVGGPEAWRWAFFVIAVLAVPLVLRPGPPPRAPPGPSRDAGRAGRGARRPGRAPDLAQRRLRAPADDQVLPLLPAGHGQPRPGPVQPPAVPQPVPGGGARPRRLRTGPVLVGHLHPRHLRHRDRGQEQRPPLPGQPAGRGDAHGRTGRRLRDLRRPRPVDAQRGPGRDRALHRHRDGPGRVHGRLRHDGRGPALPAPVPGHRHGRRLPVLLRRVLRCRPDRRPQRRHRPPGRGHHRGPALQPDRRGVDGLRRPLHPGRHLPLRRGAPGGAGGAGSPPRGRGRGAGDPGPQPGLRLRHGAGAPRRRPSTSTGARRWPCSAPTVRASPRCCGSSAGWACPSAASCGSTGAPSPTPIPRSG